MMLLKFLRVVWHWKISDWRKQLFHLTTVVGPVRRSFALGAVRLTRAAYSSIRETSRTFLPVVIRTARGSRASSSRYRRRYRRRSSEPRIELRGAVVRDANENLPETAAWTRCAARVAGAPVRDAGHPSRDCLESASNRSESLWQQQIGGWRI